uniref:Uncharacterized protein n=1 Tax=Sphaerodactylus townsendi TaxID=933632 RepID=A0ACB8FKJ4_9SAUR
MPSVRSYSRYLLMGLGAVVSQQLSQQMGQCQYQLVLEVCRHHFQGSWAMAPMEGNPLNQLSLMEDNQLNGLEGHRCSQLGFLCNQFIWVFLPHQFGLPCFQPHHCFQLRHHRFRSNHLMEKASCVLVQVNAHMQQYDRQYQNDMDRVYEVGFTLGR